MPNDVRPYLVSLSGVSWQPWSILAGETWSPLPELIEGWDAGTDLMIRRSFDFDPERFGSETGLAPADLVATVSWTSSTTGMTEAASPQPVPQEGVGTLEALLPGNRISGVLHIRTTLTLARAPRAALPGVARIPGSILADDLQRLALEGGSSMFPVHEIDFSHTSLAPDASWHLETTGDLGAPFLGTFRLLINTRDAELCSAVARGVKDKRQQALCEELQAGVAMLLIELGTREGDQLREQEWPADSVGDVLGRVLLRAGMTDEIPPSAHDVADFRTRLDAAVRRSGQGRTFR